MNYSTRPCYNMVMSQCRIWVDVLLWLKWSWYTLIRVPMSGSQLLGLHKKYFCKPYIKSSPFECANEWSPVDMPHWPRRGYLEPTSSWSPVTKPIKGNTSHNSTELKLVIWIQPFESQVSIIQLRYLLVLSMCFDWTENPSSAAMQSMFRVMAPSSFL